jgi:hypothetical protein
MGERQALHYHIGTRTADQLSEDVAEFWRTYDRDPELRGDVAKAGIDAAAIAEVDRDTSIRFSEDAGLDPLTVTLIVTFAPVAATVTRDLWTKVILPRIERRWGNGSVGGSKPN